MQQMGKGLPLYNDKEKDIILALGTCLKVM